MLESNAILQNRYQIVRLLGSGGMGAVYEAIDERFGEPIALKETTIDPAKCASEEQRESLTVAFKREAETLAKAKHEGIPYVRDYFLEDDRQFIVMELVEGDDLAELLTQNNKPLPFVDVFQWVDQLLDVLDYLHNLSPPIIHRDIKPQNLKLKRGKIKLLDFGIAKIEENSGDGAKEKTFVAASRNYSPIEQLLHALPKESREFFLLKYPETAESILNQKSDPRSDIYSAGATFYHLLTNVTPIESSERILQICDGKADPLKDPKELNPTIQEPISAVLTKAMAIERKYRFSSSAEMRIAFLEAAADHSNLEDSSPEAVVNSDPVTDSSSTWSTELDILDQSKTGDSVVEGTKPSLLASARAYYVKDTEPSELDATEPRKNPTASLRSIVLSSENDRRLLLLLPIFAFGLLAIGSVGGSVLVFSNGGGESESPAENLANKVLTPAPTVLEIKTPTPSGTPDIDIEPDEREPRIDSRRIRQKKSVRKPKKSRTPKKIWRLRSTPKSPRTPVKTPTPKISPKPKNLKCIYDNSC